MDRLPEPEPQDETLLTTEMQQGWKSRLNGAGARSLFRTANAHRNPPPADLTPAILNGYLYRPTPGRYIPTAHKTWLDAAVQQTTRRTYKPLTESRTYKGHAIPVLRVTRGHLINSMPRLYELAGEMDLQQHAFLIDSKTAGFVIPALKLADYLAAQPKKAGDITMRLMGTREAYEHFKKPDHLLTQTQAAVILRTGEQKEEIRYLAIVTPHLKHEIARFAMDSKSYAFPPDDMSIHDNKEGKKRIASILFRKTDEIAALCAAGKPVIAKHAGPAFIAVPIETAAALDEQLFNGQAAKKVITATSFNHLDVFRTAAYAGEFITVTKGTGWQARDIIKPVFTLVPFHLAEFLDLDSTGIIKGIKDGQTARLTFRAAAALDARGDHADVHVGAPYGSAAYAWLKMLERSPAPETVSLQGQKLQPVEPDTQNGIDNYYIGEGDVQISMGLTPTGTVRELAVDFKNGAGALVPFVARNVTVHLPHRTLHLTSAPESP